MSNYTLADKSAMAISRNCSYGRIQVCLEYGLPLPPLVRSTRWPKGSAHIGEDALPGDIPETEEQDVSPKRPSKKKYGSGVKILNCEHCGAKIPSNKSVHVYVHTPKESWPQGLKYADICPNCANEVLPMQKKAEKEPLYDADGHKVPIRSVCRCNKCNKLHDKRGGAQVYVQTPGDTHPKLHSYFCMKCLPVWKASIKKSTQPAEGIESMF